MDCGLWIVDGQCGMELLLNTQQRELPLVSLVQLHHHNHITSSRLHRTWANDVGSVPPSLPTATQSSALVSCLWSISLSSVVTLSTFCCRLLCKMEEQILLRVPPEIALRLNRLIDEAKSTSSSTPSSTTATANQSPISLTFTSNNSVTLQCDKQSLDGTVVELPCIIETLKTFDNIAYYKTADIAQMIILHAAQLPANNPPTTNTNTTQPANPASLSSSQQPVTADKAKDAIPPPPIKYPSGLLPPTRDIRPKRFERDTLIQPRIVSDVETMLMYIRDETPVHTFRLIEEEVEIEVDDEPQHDEWEDETDTAMAVTANSPTSAARPTSSSTTSQPLKPSPLPSIRIDTDTAGGSGSMGLSPSASGLRPPTSSRMSPSFSPAFLGGGGGSGTPSFTPSLGTADEDERMREVLDDSEVSLLPSPRTDGAAEEEKAQLLGASGAERSEERSEEQKRAKEETRTAEAEASQASAEAAGRDSRRSVLVAELADLERRIEEVNAQINKEARNQLIKRRMQSERLQPLEEERNAKRKELEAL